MIEPRENDLLPRPPRRRQGDRFFRDLLDVLAKGDMQLSAVMMGFGLILWGSIGVIQFPSEVERAAVKFALGSSPILWALNYIGVGMAFIWVGVKKFPHPQSVLLGSYCAMIWTMIAAARPTENMTSGTSLNVVVIIMGLMLIQRSGRK